MNEIHKIVWNIQENVWYLMFFLNSVQRVSSTVADPDMDPETIKFLEGKRSENKSSITMIPRCYQDESSVWGSYLPSERPTLDYHAAGRK